MSLWPICIFEDRYSGAYSGGKWVAMGRCDRKQSRDNVEAGVNGGDLEFWTNERKALMGLGDTPNAALADLEAKAAAMDDWWPRWAELDDPEMDEPEVKEP